MSEERREFDFEELLAALDDPDEPTRARAIGWMESEFQVVRARDLGGDRATEILGAIPGAFEQAQEGRADAEAGRVIALEEFRRRRRGPRSSR